jgi:2-methylisocitrate lyase-like PEP mutase family enzyme
VDDLAAMGVRRISTGGTLARTAWNGFIRAAREIAERGTFKSFDGTIPNAELNAFFREDRKKRASS